VRRFTLHPKVDFTLDLHVLGLPPAFVLSQDQTLQFDLGDRPATVYALSVSRDTNELTCVRTLSLQIRTAPERTNVPERTLSPVQFSKTENPSQGFLSRMNTGAFASRNPVQRGRSIRTSFRPSTRNSIFFQGVP